MTTFTLGTTTDPEPASTEVDPRWIDNETRGRRRYPANQLEAYVEEISRAYHVIHSFYSMDTTEVFEYLSQFTGRASEIRSQIILHETKSQRAFRCGVLDPFIEECDRQFKFISRKQSTLEVDARMAGGRFT